MKHLTLLLFLFSIWFTVTLTGCKGESGGTTGGNPGIVALQSTAFTKTASSFSSLAVGDFRFCVTKLKLVTTSTGTSASYEAQLGLIDVSDETQTTAWGPVVIPLEQDLEEIHVELHVDSEVCSGENFSLSYKNTPLTKDLEFKFRFDPPVSLGENDVINLGLTNIAAALEAADQAGKLDNHQISEFLNEETRGTAEKE